MHTIKYIIVNLFENSTTKEKYLKFSKLFLSLQNELRTLLLVIK